MSKKTEIRARNLSRLNAMLTGAAPHEKFMTMAAATQLAPEDLDTLLNETVPEHPVDFNAQVGPEGRKRPAHHWLGKSREQLLTELGNNKDVDALVSELEEHGITIPDVTPAPSPERIFEDIHRNPMGVPRRPTVTPEGGAQAPESSDATEPTFGEDQTPFSELRGSTDEELRAQGIGAEGIAQIRKLEDEARRWETEQDRITRANEAYEDAAEAANENPADPATAAYAPGLPASVVPQAGRQGGATASTAGGGTSARSGRSRRGMATQSEAATATPETRAGDRENAGTQPPAGSGAQG